MTAPSRLKACIFTHVLTLALLSPAKALFAQTSTPFLPGAGQADVSLTYVYQGFQDYRGRHIEASLPDTLSQNSVFVSGDYGLSKRIAFDFTSGYTRASLQKSVSSGVADTTLGLRVLIYQGEHVTFTGRGDAIIAGSYPLSSLGPFAAGLGANGFLSSLLLGVTGPRGVYLSFESGAIVYSHPTPDYYLGAATFGQRIGRFNYMGGYQEQRALSGVAIDSPSFVPSQFNQLKGIEGDLVAGVGISQKNGLTYNFTYVRFLHNSDSGQKDAYAFTVGYHFGGTHPHF